MGLLRNLLIFGAGVYAGLYADQQYQMPRVDDPKDLLKQLNEFLEKYKKNSGDKSR